VPSVARQSCARGAIARAAGRGSATPVN
jgi:hypothetical protein